MQLRDAARLDLEDTLDVHLEGVAHRPTLRRLLSHASGLQRETHDDAWLRARFADVEELLGTLDRAEQVLPSGARFHYSNLAFALLGAVVERVSGSPYVRYVEERLLQPLGLGRVGFAPEEPAAVGYLVEPYADDVLEQAPVETGAWVAAGQVWGTVPDLCRWVWFLAEPDEGVLARSTTDEMRTVQTISDHVRWTSGYGLGLLLLRDGERILVGHSGSMPGFIAAAYVAPADRVAAAMGGGRIEVCWRSGTLEAAPVDKPDWKPPAVLQRDGTDRWRVISGWEQGELLRVERDEAGEIVRLVLAGYPVTREPTRWV